MTLSNYTPAKGTVLIKVFEEESETGIIVSIKKDVLEDLPDRGRIVKMNTDIKEILINDMVLFDKLRAIEIEFSDEGTYVLVDVKNIFGVLK